MVLPFVLEFAVLFALRAVLVRWVDSRLFLLSLGNGDASSATTLPTVKDTGASTGKGSGQVGRTGYYCRLASSWAISEALFLLLISLVLPSSTASDFPLSHRAASINWTLSLHVLLVISILALPTLSFGATLSPKLAVVPLVLWFWTFYALGRFVPLTTTSTFLTSSIARLALVGILAIGLISGSSAVLSPVNSISRFQPHVSSDQIAEIERALGQAQDDHLVKQRQIHELESRMEEASRSDAQSGRTGGSGFLSRLMDFDSSSESSRLKSARVEAAGLIMLVNALTLDLERLHSQRDSNRAAKSLRGRLMNLVGWLMSAYCIYRTVVAIINLVTPSWLWNALLGNKAEEQTRDPVAYITALVLTGGGFHLGPEQTQAIGELLSVVFVALMIASTARQLNLILGKAFRWVSSSPLPSAVTFLLLSQAFAIFAISTLVQLAPFLPGSKQGLPGLPHIDVFGTIFDLYYLIGAGVTAAVLYYTHFLS